MSLNNVLPVNEINSINVLGKKVLGKKNKFFSVLPDALEVNNLRSNKPCSEVLRSMNASNFFASAPSLQRAKQLETQARQQNHKRKLYYASLEYVRYADENLNVTKPSFPCAKSELDSYLVILDQKLSYYKQAFLCAYDSNKDSFALKIAKKILALGSNVGMAEVYFKAGSICEADYAIHQQISNELHSQSYIPRLKHKNLSSTSSSMNKNADTTVSKLDLALAFYYRANNGDLLYVLKADSAYERLHKQMCNSNDYDPIIAREKPNLLLSDM